MYYEIEVYCTCGEKAKYRFAHEESAREYMALWNREHSGEGHGVLSKAEFSRNIPTKGLKAS